MRIENKGWEKSSQAFNLFLAEAFKKIVSFCGPFGLIGRFWCLIELLVLKF